MNNLTGQLPPSMSGMTNLISLDLSINNLSGRIPESFAELRSLAMISLFNNKFEGPLPGFIGDLPNLEVLQIWNNNFTQGLPEYLGRNGRLRILDVTKNHLTGSIPKHLCRGDRLITLILMENYFSGPLPRELGECKSLIKIRIHKNFFNGTILAGLLQLPLLEMMQMNDNLFTGELPEEISANKLETLMLSNNEISGNIPPAIGNLINLVTLSLDTNKFSGEIPSEIFNLKKMGKLNLSNNALRGEIPASIAQSSDLISIDLSQNHLSGRIPTSISQLQDLNQLNLSRNQLEGEIPGEIGLMKRLTDLDLSYNDFVGRRPTNGIFTYLNDRFLAGNPKLCTSQSSFCASQVSVKRPSSSIATVTIVVAIAALLLLCAAWFMLRRRRLEKSRIWKLTAFQRLDFRAQDVLECLKEENIIGGGGARTVYRGSMPNGIDIFIKLLTLNTCNDKGFEAEIHTLGGIRHKNIVPLLGYLSNKESNFLLYEYMSNGSLGEVLYGTKGAHLQWESRYRIAVEAAKGLCYLHHGCSPPIIHSDVNSNNILLDSNYEAHVAGLSFHDYNDPECVYTLSVDQKSDVYGYGVVLLELITGRKAVGEFGEGVDIVRWVHNSMNEESVTQLSDAAVVVGVVDSRLTGYPLTGVMKLLKIAMMCVEEESSARPTMHQVVHMLTSPPYYSEV